LVHIRVKGRVILEMGLKDMNAADWLRKRSGLM
jgi:hypothetical protein